MSAPAPNGKAEAAVPATSPPRRPWRKHTQIVLDLLASSQFGPDHPHKPKMIEQAALYRDDLMGENPTPLEAALCEQATVCWLDLRCAESLSLVCGSNPSPVKELEYWNRRVSRAHKRLMSTLRTLGQLRRLNLVAVQINLDRPDFRSIGDRFVDHDPHLPIEVTP